MSDVNFDIGGKVLSDEINTTTFNEGQSKNNSKNSSSN